MFGLLIDSEGSDSFAGRRMRGGGSSRRRRAMHGFESFAEDVPSSGWYEQAIGPTQQTTTVSNATNWDSIFTSVANTVTAVLKLGANPNDPSSYQCPAGYYFDVNTSRCVPASGGSSSMTPILLAGAAGLAAILLLKGR